MTNSSSRYKCTTGSAFIFAIVALALPAFAWAQTYGEQLFQSKCAACHSIGSGRLVGPDLKGVVERRSTSWLTQFINSSQSLIKSGDAKAVAVFDEFNGIVMPDFSFSEAQIAELIGHIGGQTAGSSAVVEENTSPEPQPDEPISKEQVFKGLELFQGTIRFSNGGPACNACHHVKNDAVIGGGILAKELTTVFSRMGGSGVGAILGQAPFPVMQAAYKANALTQDEITYLVAFLQNADEQHLFQQPRDYGIGLFISGAVGAGLLYLLFAFIWRGRKRGSVYQSIYDRQSKSHIDNSNP